MPGIPLGRLFGLKIPRADEKSKELFMFFGVFGNDLFVRLPDDHRDELLRKKAASLLEPMKGKPMKEYVLIPQAWRTEPETVRLWVSRSLDWASKLPAKKTKK